MVDIKTFHDEVSPALVGSELPDPELQEITTNTEKKTNPTKSCRICTKSKARKESRYFWEKCKDNPALCVDPCFRVYHQQRVEKDITSLDNEN